MLRDFKFLRRNTSKNEEVENVPVNPRDSLASQQSNDGSSRPPLNTIQDPTTKPKLEQEGSVRSRIDRTPTKPKPKLPDSTLPLKTPDKHGFLSKTRYGWAKNEASESDSRNAGTTNMTPRVSRGIGKATSSCYSESNSTQSTPTKSVSKPPVSGFRNKFDGNGGMRGGNFAALYRGVPSSSGVPVTVVNTVEVPHFDLKEDPSFWMDHNVQVLIRVRPLNGVEKSTNGYNRCLKQENSQTIAWIGQPETRFTFDHVACETVDQEMLFRMAGLPMVENCLSGYNSCMFAYGQTGSGKTYTMLGEIEDLEVKPSPQRGMTPRIFEFLFARIQAEEEIRRDEKLKYNCKCSFLEIYNEQITDLLDPSATNLLLREDVKKGVYVENLTEFEVQTGSLNRKVAATNMNRESSRSHSVFTCVIESRWEKDSTTNLRFARLNLVDLAGSERQKTSGAEGERLKEAASINKSLSTLGHVIMILVDVANGKQRHVPYRDSKLTFLLQDSLGGNSKTMIIANVSPSICCGIETLNTLKFAQRAKLIQNNAVVNEDSTGDVIALQNQIRLLKEELSALKRQNVSRSLSFGAAITGTVQLEESLDDGNTYDMCLEEDDLGYESKGTVRMSFKQLNSLEATLAGALRREKKAETSIKKLEAEIEQLNRLVRQREEDTRSSKMMLRFREDKIQRMESVVRGSLPADSFLLEENKALSKEIQLLQAKVDKNPEVTRFALENIRLLDQLRRFQEFYEEGEKEILLDEISKLRDQLLRFLDGKSNHLSCPSSNDRLQEAVRISKENDSLQSELKNTLNELEECRHNLNSCLEENAKLSREINNLHAMLNSLKSSACHQDGNSKPVKDSDRNGETMEMSSVQKMTSDEQIMDLQLELDILKIILQEEKTSHAAVEERADCLTRDLEMAKGKLVMLNKEIEDANGELEEAKSVIEALESQQIFSINEMEDLRKSKSDLVKLLSEQEAEITALKKQLSGRTFKDAAPPKKIENEESSLQLKLKRMHDSLENAKKMNIWYQTDRAFKASNEEEVDEICRQAEAETAEVIVCLQEELTLLHQQVQDCHLKEVEAQNGAVFLETELKELQEKVGMLSEDNKQLLGRLEMKDGELRTLMEEWELLSSEIETILADGHEELVDAGNQLELLSSSFPQRRIWISEKVGRVVRVLSEKELLIEELGRCLEDATDKRSELECMLKSLRGAALILNEAQQQECNEKEKEIILLKKELNVKTSIIRKLEDRMKMADDDLRNASTCATVAFVLVNRLSEANHNHLNALKCKDEQLAESAKAIFSKDALLIDQATMIKEAEKHIHSLETEVEKSEEACTELSQRLLEEEQRAATIEQKLEDMVENDILKTQEELSNLKDRMKMAEDDLRNASTCATVAFVLVNRLSEANHNHLNALKGKDGQLAESAEAILSKDALLINQATMIEEAETRIHSLETEVEKSEEACTELRQRLLEEEQCAAVIEQKLEDMVENDFLKTQEELSKLEDRMKMAEDDLRNASTCATVAFVLVNRLSEANHNHLNALKGKDALLFDQATKIEEAEKHIHSLKIEVAKSEEVCTDLQKRLFEEGQHAAAIEQKLEDMVENDILKTQEELSKLRTGVSTLRAHMGMHRDSDRSSERSVKENLYTSNDGKDERRSNKRADAKNLHSLQRQETGTPDCSLKVVESLHGSRCDEKTIESGNTCKNKCDRDVTIILLKKEIESAMESLKEVQAEMARICNEKEEIRLSEKQSKEGLQCLAAHVLALEEAMNDFGKLLEVKIGAVHQKINTVEQTMQEISTHWCQTKEFLELEVGDAKIIATQKASEASCILAKFEEAQDTITEADIMINGLMIANEKMKLDIKRRKQVETALLNERDDLINQVKSLQSINTVKDQQLEDLEEQFGSSLTETRFMVAELEGLITELQTAFSQSVKAVACDSHCLKSLLFDSMKLARSWLEDVWSEIIVKDCAVSVLHLCHMGILLETLTGLNAENGLLQHGLSESNAVIADLREHNSRSRRELEMCRDIKGKLLADIKNSFDRISKKEEETGELSIKLVTFEKKISALQFQEEVMLQRSNYMGSQLAVLMKELDLGNTNLVSSLLDQEQLLKDKEVQLESRAEISMVDLCTKDFESLIFSSEMKQMIVHLADSGKKLTNAYAVLDGLKKEMTFTKLDACLKEQLLVEQESELSFLQEKAEEAQVELRMLKKENCLLLQDLEEQKADSGKKLANAYSVTDGLKKEMIFAKLDACLKGQLLVEQESELSFLQEKVEEAQIELRKMKKENCLLLQNLDKKEADTGKKLTNAYVVIDGLKKEIIFAKVDACLKEQLLVEQERISKFIEEFEFLENRTEELESENMNLHAELSRKDEVLKGLLFDLSLLQESASNTKDQKDEMEEMVSTLEALEDELAVKSSELNEAVSHSHMLKVQLQEKLETITSLQLDIKGERESLKLLYSENQELKSHIEDALAVKSSLEDELTERKKITESLEVEISEMNNTLSEMKDTIEFLSSNLNEVSGERDELHMEVLSLEEKLRKAQDEAKQSEAIAMEAQQMAESKKTYAEEKEAEVKLLERSVEELECTINVLENKVEIIKGEAERQRLQREELESELDAIKVQMQNVKNADADMKRCLDEKTKDLQQALDQIQILETDISDKDREIAQCITHISELNVHAEAQAKEYKQKFKALEAMAEQVKPEGYASNAQSHSSNKLEKNVAKPRGSGSPFKCIGLGLAQQMKLEKDEDLTAARLRIEELESVAANRQKEIFSLNARLAAAESMTHDVIRDLLGVKLDMTNYVSLLDNQQLEKITEKARLDNLESQVKDHEVVKLKQQLNEFVEERQGWLEEIDRKQAELTAVQVALENVRQRDQLLKTENEMLKMENVNYKKKEENNMLKIQNEELGVKLRRTEVVLSRVREELGHYRASIGKSPCVNFDEEQRLNNKLRESDEDRVQLAHKLLALCTSVLKAAGITMPISDICPAAAEEALEQLQNKVISLERELQSLTLKNKIYSERNRLSELMPQTSPTASARTDENCHTPKRPFLSTLDR
ncbi:phragmoplast orienting kinesin 2 [Gossypium australe]|uniref:Phragmoplast orienting kinesin 2 n=1 Tax=Gossypium australe TaxID=47621 RepID=A0A5B6WMY0_9ROSI|nr:phragmoplast orienting kinesin 2 [Gossypium australe]